ncbi:MAG: hypothetical protein ACREOG_23465 [Gemmatimonadaceae bacterium]
MRRALLRTSAVLLALATAAFLVQLGRGSPRPPSLLLVARALTLGALLHAGLFWSTEARRGWQRLVAAGAMLPSVLILAGMAGEAVTHVVRGYPLDYLTTVPAVVGLLAYAAAFWFLAGRGKHADA